MRHGRFQCCIEKTHATLSLTLRWFKKEGRKMDRLSIYLSFMTGSVLTGGLVIAAFSAGYMGWPVIIACVVIGWLFAWPSAYVISRRIKKWDNGWNHEKVENAQKPVPKPGAPEV
jgi:uncharacterized membrane protein YraQ (UPF0718 family)